MNLRPSVQQLFGRKLYLFQQDNTRPHTAKLTLKWLSSKRVPISEWSAESPDISPIENIKKILKKKVEQRRHLNIQQMKDYPR